MSKPSTRSPVRRRRPSPRPALSSRSVALLVAAWVLLSLHVPASGQEPDHRPPPPTGNEHTLGNLPYMVTTPEGWNGETPTPVILFLHGGDRSNTRHHPLRHATYAGIEDFPFLVVAPHCTGSCSWSNVDFGALLDAVAEEYPVDAARIYLTGYSMGGYGAWHALAHHPDRFAAAAPIAGGGDPEGICAARGVAVRAYHGDQDAVIPHARSRSMIDALEACDGDAELITYTGVGHPAWLKTFQDPRFYEWLLDHRRGPVAQEP